MKHAAETVFVFMVGLCICVALIAYMWPDRYVQKAVADGIKSAINKCIEDGGMPDFGIGSSPNYEYQFYDKCIYREGK